MEVLWNDFLVKQAAVIVVLGLVVYFMYKYFVAESAKKDGIIAAKDLHIEEQNKEVMLLYKMAIETQTKSIQLQEQLIDLIKEVKNDIHELHKKI